MLIFYLLITDQPALQAAFGLLVGHLFAKALFDIFTHGHFTWSAQRHDLAGGGADVVDMVDILTQVCGVKTLGECSIGFPYRTWWIAAAARRPAAIALI